MHPFYGPSATSLAGGRARVTGLLSMAAYLAFWAGAVALAKRELDAWFPVVAPTRDRPERGRLEPDPAIALVRQRFARGEIDAQEYRAMLLVLAPDGADAP